MADRIRILFVDDEVRILEGLARMFRPQRQEWEMFTANGGSAALELLARQTVDVVVSDMRMPGIDGAELLRRVRDMQPDTVRIVLSGQSEHETAMRTVGPCHHYLSKPCDPALLIAIVRRSCALRRRLADPAIQARMTLLPADLPSLPALYLRLVEELHQPDPSMPRLTAIIEQDVGMAGRLLQAVNSPAFGLERRVVGISDAVALAGIDALRSLLLAIHLLDHCHQNRLGALGERLWRHSLATARLANAIAKSEHSPSGVISAAYTAGLLHDCGKLILMAGDTERYGSILAGLQPTGRSLLEIEQETYGVGHDRIGGWLLNRWMLPDTVVEAVTFHHVPGELEGTDFPVAGMVHVADALVADEGADVQPRLEAAYLTNRGRAEQLAAWQALAQAGGGRA
jgi:putative nucleotidyltransferase with HDIG domain